MDTVLEFCVEAVRAMAAERRKIADEVETAGNFTEGAKWRDDAIAIDRVLLAIEQNVTKADHDFRVTELLEANNQEVERRRAAERTAERVLSQLVAEPSAYLVWSNEHRAWWRPKSAGYTVFLDTAGRYSREEAVRICRNARGGWRPGEPPPEVPVREVDAVESQRGP